MAQGPLLFFVFTEPGNMGDFYLTVKLIFERNRQSVVHDNVGVSNWKRRIWQVFFTHLVHYQRRLRQG